MRPISKTWRSTLTMLATMAAPLLVVLPAMYLYVKADVNAIAEDQVAKFKPMVTEAHKEGLKNTVKIAQKVIAHVRKERGDTPEARREALALLRQMDAGDDYYLFVYDLHGISLMHPRLSDWEGKSKWDLEDKNGVMVIQRLIEAAMLGGGYVNYVFNRPQTNQPADKLGYAEQVKGWDWMIGTGLYFDQLEQTNALIASTTGKAMSGITSRFVMVGLLGIVAVIAVGLSFNVVEQQRANERLRAMAQKVVLSQEMERTRVARELHDGVSQWLASVKFVFESAFIHSERNSSETTGILRSGLQQMRDVMREVRRISHDLRPTLLDDLPLSTALEQTVREFGERSGVRVVPSISEPLSRIPDAVATAVFRLTQEALGNIERHAQATEVQVDLVFEGRPYGLYLEIRDNGAGFDVDELMRKPREGLGLTNMRERIEMLDGVFGLRSSSRGTTVSIFLPPDTLKAASA